ncbi:MAG: hypothetical protein A2277_02115 [Desulfobacterales bacterium RIFOXYA12_FULL_46_15]|nr:MAG: hypothetical protein A2277_02115 [Desulfobacterales bacterium RIFOXYA12_FULL_46_15]
MKILYGMLQQRGLEVDVIFSGCKRDKVYDPSIIKTPGFYKGFTFSVKNGRIQLLNTIKDLSLKQFLNDVKTFDAKSYDLVITDFEPVSAWIARKIKCPCIGIGHQYSFLHDVPMDRSNPLSRWIIKYFAPADISIGMHWHHFDQPIVPPVIPAGIASSDTMDESLILVYLPFESKDHIRDLLLPFTKFRFAVYAQSQGEEIREEEHIRMSQAILQIGSWAVILKPQPGLSGKPGIKPDICR